MSQPAYAAAQSVTGRSPSRMAWERIKKDRTAKVSGSVILIFIALAILAPIFTWIIHSSPDAFHTETLNQEFGTQPLGKLGGVSGAHWFGVEPRTGRDIFLRFVLVLEHRS